jgi:hypothetical protein
LGSHILVALLMTAVGIAKIEAKIESKESREGGGQDLQVTVDCGWGGYL